MYAYKMYVLVEMLITLVYPHARTCDEKQVQVAIDAQRFFDSCAVFLSLPLPFAGTLESLLRWPR